MKLTSIPQAYRNVNRATEILSVLSKYGLADWISRFNLEFAKGLLKAGDGEPLARQTREIRIRMALQDLGPTFIKLGQLLSTRPELVGRALADELSKLQDSGVADPPDTVHKTVEQELGQSIDTLFLRFDDKPIASASIGLIVCMSNTRASIPLLASVSAASRAAATMRPQAIRVTSEPSRIISALPIFSAGWSSSR